MDEICHGRTVIIRLIYNIITWFKSQLFICTITTNKNLWHLQNHKSDSEISIISWNKPVSRTWSYTNSSGEKINWFTYFITKQVILQKGKGKPSKSSLLLVNIKNNSKYLTYSVLDPFWILNTYWLNHHNKTIKYLLVSPFYLWENWSRDKLISLSMVTGTGHVIAINLLRT